MTSMSKPPARVHGDASEQTACLQECLHASSARCFQLMVLVVEHQVLIAVSCIMASLSKPGAYVALLP